MGTDIKNYLGAILALVGAVLMILATFVPAMADLCDQNWYTVGSLVHTLHLFHCLLQVGDNVVAVLNTDTESDEVGTYASFE